MGHFTEPHHIGPQTGGSGASGAWVGGTQIEVNGKSMPAETAKSLQKLSVHMDNRRTTTSFVEIVNGLGNHRHTAGVLLFQTAQSRMRR